LRSRGPMLMTNPTYAAGASVMRENWIVIVWFQPGSHEQEISRPKISAQSVERRISA
jgi:hypothetical protein